MTFLVRELDKTIFKLLSSTDLPLTATAPVDLLNDPVSKRLVALDNSSVNSCKECEHVLDPVNLLWVNKG